MAERTFKLEVITPDRKVFSDDKIVSVTMPGIEGYFGVLANHAALMTALGIGELDLRNADGAQDSMAVSGGFVEVLDNKVTVLSDSAELAADIDLSRAKESAHRAEERITVDGPDIDMDRAQASLARALNRIKVAERQ